MKTIAKQICGALVLSGLIHCSALAQSGPPPLPQPMDLLDIWYFQDTNWFDAFGDPPLSYTNLTLVSTWDGNGLQVDSSDPAWLSYPFESDGYPNLYFTNGTIRFWFVPNWASTNLGGSGPGDWGRLIDVGAWTSNASYGWWSLYVDPAGCNIYFSAQTNNGLETNYLYAPIAWDGTTWHEIELTYSASNTTLYLDGALATNGPGISILPPPDTLTNGFYVGSDWTGLQQSHGQFDELWTFGNQQTDTNDIANEYAQYNAIANPPPHIGPLGDDAPSPPGDGEGGTNSGSGGINGPYNPPYGSNQFWLQILALGTNAFNADSNSLTLILYGTTNGSAYQIWTATNLTPPITWTQQQIFPGSTNTNFTVFLFPMTNGPTMFFTAVNYSQDTDGDGLPDWWEMEYSTTSFPLSPTNADTGNTGIPDGYKQDSAGDGYNNLQKFQMGIPPNVFITPPAPNNFTAILNTNGNITFSWSASPNLPSYGAGAVIGYTLQIAAPLGDLFTNITLGASQTSYVFTSDSATEGYLSSGDDFPDVSLQVNYANTNSASASSAPFNYGYQIEANIVRGPQGRLNLIAPNIPSGVQAIRVYVNENIYGTSYPKDISFMQNIQYLTSNPAYGGGYAYSFDAPVSGFTNGVYVIPYSQIPVYLSQLQYSVGAVANDGSVGPPPPDKVWAEFVDYVSNIPFLDGRTNLQQNLTFLLQAANASEPLAFYAVNSSGSWAYNIPPGPDYVSAGYCVDTVYQYYDGGYDPSYSFYMNEFQPFEDNYCYRNFVVTTAEINSDGSLSTGVTGQPYWFFTGDTVTNNPAFTFDTYTYCQNGYTNTPPAILTNWQYSYYSGDIGVYLDYTTSPPKFKLSNNASNYYGLPITSVEVADFTNGNMTLHTLTTGSPVSQLGNHTYYFFPQMAAPELVTTNYYFARITPYGTYSIDPQPGDGIFASTNTSTPLMFASVGGVYGFSAWAKQEIVNGDPSKSAYLQQYFDQAYLCDTNGDVTTNQAGILSEYGEFMPFYPGQVALVTKPDITTGQRGTNVIHVIGLQLDFNHDGTMDPSFMGPDSTSPARPFQFWINNNYDRWHTVDITDSEQDDLLIADCPYAPDQNIPDYNYTNLTGNRAIPCTRDLEDFARLWVSGIDSNLLAALPSNSTVTLSWGDVGYPNPGNPTIDLFQAADPNGGTGYLTNASIATNQIDPILSPYIGRLGPGGSIQLNACEFDVCWRGNYFIWCGVSNGSGNLSVTISDAYGNVLGAAGAYIQLQDIKQMYERWTVGDAPDLAPSNTAYLAQDDFTPGQSTTPFKYGPSADTNTPYILFVHGWNMESWKKDRFAETMFKRLYWQGYQGRFGIFRWPCATGILSFDDSEFNAWKSAAPLYAFLTNLNALYPNQVYVMSHSQGAIVCGEALRLAGTNEIMNTYIAAQGAIASHDYDASATNRYAGGATPDREAQYYTNGAPCYFNGVAGAGTYINFFNTNDWALTLLWPPNQNLKPDLGWDWNGTNYYEAPATGGRILYFPADTYEIFSHIIQAQCYALGSQKNVNGAFAGSQVELDIAPYNFGTPHKDHSGEFRSDTVHRWSFWDSILGDFGITN